MDLLKQKKLDIGVCMVHDKDMNGGEYFALPCYFAQVNGVLCAIGFDLLENRNWLLADAKLRVILAQYDSFDAVAAALRDGAWVREKHEALAAQAEPAAETEQAEEEATYADMLHMDNPPKGRPGIVLVPDRDYMDDTSNLSFGEDVGDNWDDEDWDEDEGEWIEEESDAADNSSASESASDTAGSGDDSSGDDEAEDESWGDDSEDRTKNDDWDDDEDWGDEDDWDDSAGVLMLEPRAAYIFDVDRRPIAVYTTLIASDTVWWEALDVQTGMGLCSSQSLSETIRIAPLRLITARAVASMNPATEDYLVLLQDVLSFQSRQKVESYLTTGYLKLNGQEYLQLMNELYDDPVELEDMFLNPNNSSQQ